MSAFKKRLRKAVSCGSQRTADPGRGNGADAESTGSDSEAAAGKLKWWDAAEIMGVTDRTMRRWRERLDQNGYSGLWDYGKRSPSPKGSDENGGGGVATLPGEVLRLQR